MIISLNEITEKSIVTLKNANAIEKLLELLNSDAGDESKRKATWALQNLLSEGNFNSS